MKTNNDGNSTTSPAKKGRFRGSSIVGPTKQEETVERGDRIFALMLGFMYASFIACRQFFSTTQAAIVEDPTLDLDTNLCANVVVVAGIGFGVAKVVTGLLVDKFESRTITYIFMLATAITVFGFSFSESYEAMLFLGFLNAIPQAGGYPALNKIVYDTLPPEQYGQAIAAISIGSRVGASGSYLIFGACLKYFSWRQTVRIAPLIVLMAMVISSMVLFKKNKYKETQKNSDRKEEENEKGTVAIQRSIPQKLAWIAGDSQFWRVSIASACLLVSKGFEAIAPLYISSVLKLSPSASAMLVAAIPAGLVASVVWGASYVDRLEPDRKSAWMVSLCCVNILTCSIICGLTWYLENGGECEIFTAVVTCMVMFFSLGFSAGYCFYVPQSIYAIEFGGADSATVIGCSELIQAAVGAGSLKMAGSVSLIYGWRYVWALITAFAVVGALSMAAFQRRVVLKQKEHTA